MLVSLLRDFEGAAESLENFFATLEGFHTVHTKSFKRLYKRSAKIHASYLTAVTAVKRVKAEMKKLEIAKVKANQDNVDGKSLE